MNKSSARQLREEFFLPRFLNLTATFHSFVISTEIIFVSVSFSIFNKHKHIQWNHSSAFLTHLFYYLLTFICKRDETEEKKNQHFAYSPSIRVIMIVHHAKPIQKSCITPMLFFQSEEFLIRRHRWKRMCFFFVVI